MGIGGLDDRTSAIIFIWVSTAVFLIAPVAMLYVILTLNPIGIAILVLITILQHRFAGKSQKCIQFVRKYFPPDRFFNKCEVIFEDENLPEEKVMYAYGPHCVMPHTLLMNQHRDNHPFFHKTVLGSRLLLSMPIYGFFMSLWGMEGVQSGNMRRLMSAKKNICLVPGGFEEATLTTPKAVRMYIEHRKGFIKMALNYGYNIVPTLILGENQIFYTFDYLTKFRMFLNKIKLPGVIFWSKYGLLPDPNHEVYTIVGKPIKLPELKKPTHEQVDQWHKTYVTQMLALYEKHKHLCKSLPIQLY